MTIIADTTGIIVISLWLDEDSDPVEAVANRYPVIAWAVDDDRSVIPITIDELGPYYCYELPESVGERVRWVSPHDEGVYSDYADLLRDAQIKLENEAAKRRGK